MCNLLDLSVAFFVSSGFFFAYSQFLNQKINYSFSEISNQYFDLNVDQYFGQIPNDFLNKEIMTISDSNNYINPAMFQEHENKLNLLIACWN